MSKSSKVRSVRGFPWYVILFLIYPPLNLLAQNIGEVDYSAANRAIVVILVAGFLFLFLLKLLLRDWQKIGVLFSLLAFLFFSYGYVLNYFASFDTALSAIGRHRYMAPVWFLLAVLGVIWAVRTKLKLGGLVSALKTISVVLIIFPVLQLSSFAYKNWTDIRAINQVSTTLESATTTSDSKMPDIYYIILDAYGRSDVLKKELDFDNTAFIDHLEQQGFYVANCSQSNYGQTAISLATSLNMEYLNSLGDEFVPGNKDRYVPLWNLIETNKVKETLRQNGYKIVAFETGYDWTEFHDADYFFEPPQRGMTDFESLLLRNSGTLFLDYYGVFDKIRLTPEDQKRNLILYVLDQLSEVPKLPGPKFVFVHLAIPHQPFVLGPNGEVLVVAPRTLNQDSYYKRDDYLRGYQNQVTYISKRIPEIMSQIISGSSSPVVIVLQGDHGPGHLSGQERMEILNAYYFPEGRASLYPSITPVNTFRMIFNTYLGTSLEMLPDESYYSTYARPYDLQETVNTCVDN